MTKKRKVEEKAELHKRNRNRKRYDLDAMTMSFPELKEYIRPNKYGVNSIDFSNPGAVKALNRAILSHYYGIKNWEFPDENLCPPIPGRAEYIHHIADLLSNNNKGVIPRGMNVTCLDIGTGASCIYPIIGITEYDWNFIGTDINKQSILSAQKIVSLNPSLKGKVICRLQNNSKHIFQGVIEKEDRIDIVICNPPFHSTKEEAVKGTNRKLKNLNIKRSGLVSRNHAGVHQELIYEGGEVSFIGHMISESKNFGKQCLWFSSLVSKESNLKKINLLLKEQGHHETRTIEIRTGNKSSRIIAWTFFTERESKIWVETRAKGNIE